MTRDPWDQGRFHELEPIAIVDIGSNSVRLVVYEGAVRAPFPLYNEKILCGLGRAQTDDGCLTDESIVRALSALRRFRAIARTLRAKNIHAIATAAVRDAGNGADFIDQAQQAIGTEVHILSGEREAELAANGITMGFVDPDGIGGDLGGGSLELIDLSGGRLGAADTVALGGLRLLEKSGGRLSRSQTIIEKELAKLAWLKGGRGRTLYAIGGTWRALAKLHMEYVDAPLRVMHGYSVKRSDMMAFCKRILAGSGSDPNPLLENASRSRRETLPYGTLVLTRLLEQAKPRDITFSIFGIREGLLYSYLSRVEQAKDPMLAFCEDFARLRSRSLQHSKELCNWTDRLFKEAGVEETAQDRRLRHAACLLSDIEWRAQADHRGEQSLYVLAHAPSTGLNHEDRLFVALSVYFRHAGRGETRGDELSGRLRSCISRQKLERAQLIAAAVRAAHMISIGMPGIIEDVAVEVKDGTLTLQLPQAYADFEGERLQRRLRALGGRLGLSTQLRKSR